MKRFHIFAGGVFHKSDIGEISAQDIVICADRGLKHALTAGITPDIIVGDFDSYTDKLPENCEIHRSVPEKDDTDTMLAVKIAIERGAQEIILYGAMGGRFDHTFANIQTLEYARIHGCKAIIRDFANIISMQSEGGEKTYKREKNSYFSVFAYTEKVLIEKLCGVKYPLENHELTTGFPLGVSNEITAEEAVLKIKEGTVLVVQSEM